MLDVAELSDDQEIAAVLEDERVWAVYAICDLEPPHRRHARFVGARRDGRLCSVLLVYTPPGFTAVLPCGDGAGVRSIFESVESLPTSCLILSRRGDLAAAELRYEVSDRWTMLRMAVSSEELRAIPPVEARVVRLSGSDLPALRRLYAPYPESVFQQSMFDDGIYYGAYVGGDLAAAAGTHAISRRHHIGVIGNVFTAPAHRGKGLAKAVTGAVAKELVRHGAQLVALNVREDNAPAIAAYAALGFSVHFPFWEARGALRLTPSAPPLPFPGPAPRPPSRAS